MVYYNASENVTRVNYTLGSINKGVQFPNALLYSNIKGFLTITKLTYIIVHNESKTIFIYCCGWYYNYNFVVYITFWAYYSTLCIVSRFAFEIQLLFLYKISSRVYLYGWKLNKAEYKCIIGNSLLSVL